MVHGPLKALLKEYLEVINHKDAIVYLEELVEKGVILSEWDIKNIHRLVLKTIDNNNAGTYRTENVIISGAKHKPPQHLFVKEQMANLIKQYNVEWQGFYPIERAALLHGEFVKIHPFVDGNGRTARLLLNFELMKTGFPPVIIKKEIRSEHYESLDHAHTTGDYGNLLNLWQNARKKVWIYGLVLCVKEEGRIFLHLSGNLGGCFSFLG